MPQYETKGDPAVLQVIRLGPFSYNQVEKKYYYTDKDGTVSELVTVSQGVPVFTLRNYNVPSIQVNEEPENKAHLHPLQKEVWEAPPVNEG